MREPSHYVINLLADFRETLSQIVSNHGQCKPLRLAMSRVKKTSTSGFVVGAYDKKILSKEVLISTKALNGRKACRCQKRKMTHSRNSDMAYLDHIVDYIISVRSKTEEG